MSILSVDFGSIYTRIVLLDQVDGIYQLIARSQTRTTDAYPINDLSVGFDRALRELSDKTQRIFVDEMGMMMMPETVDRRGVDFFSVTASLGRPLKVVVVGRLLLLVDDIDGAGSIHERDLPR